MSDKLGYDDRQPVNAEPPHIPGGDVYETHKQGEWIAIADSVYADVINALWLEDYNLSFEALETGKMWVHIRTAWEFSEGYDE